MSGYFLDTSALVKRYHTETGSDVVARLFSEPAATLFVSRLGIVETTSALMLKVRSGEISIEDFACARAAFLIDLKRRVFVVARVGSGQFKKAESLILRHGAAHRLRSLDAIQLAVALDLLERKMVDALASADGVLCDIARIEGLRAVNPVKP